MQLLSKCFRHLHTTFRPSQQQSEASQASRVHAGFRPSGLSRNKTVRTPNVADAANARQRVDAMLCRLSVNSARLAEQEWLRTNILIDCILCEERGVCRLWLADPEADPQAYKHFCPNAERFRTLN